MVEGPTNELDNLDEVSPVPSRRTDKTRIEASSPAQISPTERILTIDLTHNCVSEPVL